ncbi:MAG: 2OG-Fe(II) oxygenase [Gammaproteobacteria bacterium]
MLLIVNPFVLPFDCYLLRFKQGAGIPAHTDPVASKKHYRLNIVLRNADEGGRFECHDAIYNGRRIKLFRPDQSRHSVSPIRKGVRYVLSIGWVLK